MKWLKILGLALLGSFVLMMIGFNLWGMLTLGTVTPDPESPFQANANKVVMVFGATGSAGDGLLKAAMEDTSVEKIYAVTRRNSERIDRGVASGRVEMILLQDFTDYSGISEQLAEVNTVLWGLGTSSLNVDDATYTLIHVDFPIAFIKEWLGARRHGPMAFHFITGVGTDPEGSDHWAREKGRTEREMAALAQNTGLRTFSYRSAYIRPTSEQSNALVYLLELMLKPGDAVIRSIDLGRAMLEISARTEELPNGTLIDNLDSILYAQQYRERYGL